MRLLEIVGALWLASSVFVLVVVSLNGRRLNRHVPMPRDVSDSRDSSESEHCESAE
jgi:hypothetical protein